MAIGGHRLSCEDFPTCARREALEEIGADVHLVDCRETWLITADGVESRLELADQPRPFALYLMANSAHTDDSQRTYYIAIYQATLLAWIQPLAWKQKRCDSVNAGPGGPWPVQAADAG